MKQLITAVALIVLSLVFVVTNANAAVSGDRAAVLKDMQQLNQAAEKLQQFQQINDRASGLPSEVDELEQMLSKAKDFLNNDLAEAKALSETLLKKYDVSSLQTLGEQATKIINPGGSVLPTAVPNGYAFLERNIQWIEQFVPQVEAALAAAQKQVEATSAELNKAKSLSSFPGDSYSGGDLGEIKQQMLTSLAAGSVIKSASEVINLSVTSGWNEGVYTDSKKEYRKIKGTALFADNDGDGTSRFTSYSFISDKVDGDWQPLKYKAFAGNPEGWAKPEKGSMSGSGKGALGGLVWILLAVVNIVAGLIAGQDMLKSKVAAVEKITAPLQPLAAIIGVAALALGLLGFVLAVLSLNILSGIIPQVTAVALGLVLGREFLKSKASGKVKEQLEKQEENLQQVSSYSQLIGVAGLVVGVLYLILGGALYVI